MIFHDFHDFHDFSIHGHKSKRAKPHRKHAQSANAKSPRNDSLRHRPADNSTTGPNKVFLRVQTKGSYGFKKKGCYGSKNPEIMLEIGLSNNKIEKLYAQIDPE